MADGEAAQARVAPRRRQPAPAMLSGWRREGMLLALGLVCALLYAVGITARYPLLAGLQTPRGSWSTLITPSVGSVVIHLAVYGALTLSYVLALRLAITQASASDRARILIVVVVWLLASVVLLGAYPGGESHDLFDYIFRGRMQTEFGASPLATAPHQYTRSAFYRYIAWYNHVDTYGPLWEYASRAVAEAAKLVLKAGGNWAPDWPSCPDAPSSCRMLVTYVTGYRLLSVALTGLSGLFVYAIARALRPRLAVAAVLAWLWNPLLLISTALGAHNDSLMLLLVLASLYLCAKSRWLSGLLVLALAAHIKLTALLFLPVWLVWLLAQRGGRVLVMNLALAAMISLPLSWALYEPLGRWATLPRMLHERGLYLANSPAALAYRLLLEDDWTVAQARQVATQGSTLLFAAAAAVVLLVLWRGMLRHRPPGPDRDGRWVRLACQAAIAISVVYLLAGSFWFQHWYLTWVLVVAALRPEAVFTWRILPWFCFGALAGNVVLDVASNLPGVLLSRAQTTAVALAVTWLPLAVAGVISWAGWAIQQRRPPRVMAAPVMK